MDQPDRRVDEVARAGSGGRDGAGADDLGRLDSQSLLRRRAGQLENDGLLAQIAYLDLIPAKLTDDKRITAADSAIIRNLTVQMRELERSVFLLRNRKAELPAELYQKEMEVLLIDLARMSRKLNKMTTAPGD